MRPHSAIGNSLDMRNLPEARRMASGSPRALSRFQLPWTLRGTLSRKAFPAASRSAAETWAVAGAGVVTDPGFRLRPPEAFFGALEDFLGAPDAFLAAPDAFLGALEASRLCSRAAGRLPSAPESFNATRLNLTFCFSDGGTAPTIPFGIGPGPGAFLDFSSALISTPFLSAEGCPTLYA
jgi:hypothetical protein